MGSGRGKSKRVQAMGAGSAHQAAVASSPPQVTGALTWDVIKWKKFVIDQGVNQISLYEYYLGREHDINCDDAEYSRVVRDLFCDAVEVGAITLPQPYEAQDFLLEVDDGSITEVSLVNGDGSIEHASYPFSGRDNANTVHTMLDQNLTHWFLNEITQKIANLLGVPIGKASSPSPVDPNWYGKNVVVTGTFSWTRREIENELRAAGAKVASSVSGKTDVLIVGDSPGSKLRKAHALSTPTLHGDADIRDLMA